MFYFYWKHFPMFFIKIALICALAFLKHVIFAENKNHWFNSIDECIWRARVDFFLYTTYN